MNRLKLPENLEKLQEGEGRIRQDSIAKIKADRTLQDHLDMVYASLNMVFDLVWSHSTTDEDELTLQYLGARLFNSIVTSLGRLLAGYYQTSSTLMRDTMETGQLLDYLCTHPEEISVWRTASEKTRRMRFNPVVVRKALDDRDGFTERKREQRYKVLCNYGAHPTYEGFRMLAPDNQVKIGPFYSEKYMKATLEELTMLVANSSINFLNCFDSLPPSFLQLQDKYLKVLGKWSARYLGVSGTD